MQALMIVKVEVLSQADDCHFGRLIIVQIDLLILDASPQPLHKDVVQGTSPSIHTNLNACGLQAAGKIAAGKLRVHAWWLDIAHANVYSYEEEEGKFTIIDTQQAKRILARLENERRG